MCKESENPRRAAIWFAQSARDDLLAAAGRFIFFSAPSRLRVNQFSARVGER
jgi:hypothetical protein